MMEKIEAQETPELAEMAQIEPGMGVEASE